MPSKSPKNAFKDKPVVSLGDRKLGASNGAQESPRRIKKTILPNLPPVRSSSLYNKSVKSKKRGRVPSGSSPKKKRSNFVGRKQKPERLTVWDAARKSKAVQLPKNAPPPVPTAAQRTVPQPRPQSDEQPAPPKIADAITEQAETSERIQIWTDGSCDNKGGGRGPCGAGAVVVFQGCERTALQPLYHDGTNNVAELHAVSLGLRTADKFYSGSPGTIEILTDSSQRRPLGGVEGKC